jgi:hypothetical protein
VTGVRLGVKQTGQKTTVFLSKIPETFCIVFFARPVMLVIFFYLLSLRLDALNKKKNKINAETREALRRKEKK